ncbi:MAG: nuclear transport factor 2 family protein [Amaricoccus sp.]
MAIEGIAEAEVETLIRRTEEATNAFLRGDMARYLELTPHRAGFTLFNPFGGEPNRYADRRDSLMAAASFFRSGEARIDLIDAHASGDLLVLVIVERQHAEVGGLPDQEWSLRVTQVYRREGEWRLVHRHADPLMTNIGLERAAELADG